MINTDKLSYIEFVLENCEVLKLDTATNDFFRCRIPQISINYSAQDNCLWENYFAKYAEFHFDFKTFKIEFSNEAVKDEVKAIKRLYYYDVTSVVFHWEDEKELQINLPWKGQDDFRKKNFGNKAMEIKHKVTQGGNEILKITFDSRNWLQKKLNRW